MRTRKRTGSRLTLPLCLCALLGFASDKSAHGLAGRAIQSRNFLASSSFVPEFLQKKTEPYAIVAGTVFRDSGLSLPGASVTLVPKDQPKAKKLNAVSDSHGEFAFRVPIAPGTYIVGASLKGFHPEEKEATVGGEGRVEVTFLLAPDSK